jgi:hypothetical protein
VAPPCPCGLSMSESFLITISQEKQRRARYQRGVIAKMTDRNLRWTRRSGYRRVSASVSCIIVCRYALKSLRRLQIRSASYVLSLRHEYSPVTAADSSQSVKHSLFFPSFFHTASRPAKAFPSPLSDYNLLVCLGFFIFSSFNYLHHLLSTLHSASQLLFSLK